MVLRFDLGRRGTLRLRWFGRLTTGQGRRGEPGHYGARDKPGRYVFVATGFMPGTAWRLRDRSGQQGTG